MIEILYEDKDIIVCVKPAGLLSQPGQEEEEALITQLQGYVDEKHEKAVIGLVHRLDRNVGGVMVFSKQSKIAALLSRDIQDRNFEKEYYAVVHNCPEEPQGTYKDLLFKDSRKNKSFVVSRPRNGVKEASLEYVVIGKHETPSGVVSLVKIKLHTGRTHQIRVQFSSRKMPLVGDGKYGSRDNKCDIALWSYRLAFNHPTKKVKMEFSKLPPDCYPWNLIM